jgi:L-histidine N-alpha-methyltransferase
MTTIALPRISPEVDLRVASTVREGLTAQQKHLPAWLFYDEAGSELFEQITRLPEYYPTRIEREIFEAHGAEMVAQAARANDAAGGQPTPLRIAELGAGSADKTRILLRAAVARPGRAGKLTYEPIDVSPTALEAARARIEQEIPEVEVLPQVMDYVHCLDLEPAGEGERRLVLYIGSSIGNFELHETEPLLRRVRTALEPGDALLLGFDLIKDQPTMVAAYNDQAGVTARFNLNLLTRLNRELDANFDLEAFSHRAIWNPRELRMEMHIESLIGQHVDIGQLGLTVHFTAGERIHTENSYKYVPGKMESVLTAAGFAPEKSWSDSRGWFSVCLARVPGQV